ncbi:hypothetical protein [Alicyclobacillus hesperidum]|uniref:hypothetical protein n=1 Tax=Alicyclobacillus hesperidum TaxID=89784 RepID=UPI000313F9C4|nr:hypothetical protein [Alicyclobacillus hesperidum]
MRRIDRIRHIIAVALGIFMMISPAPLALAAIHSPLPVTWAMQAGVQAADGVFAAAFLPNTITIDAGDTVSFSGVGQAIYIPPQGKLAPPPWTSSLHALGGDVYDGVHAVASGILATAPYHLTFVKPGTYVCFDPLHPGMEGVVIVQPTGTPYPTDASSYNAVAAHEAEVDIAAGEQELAKTRAKVIDNANGTLTYVEDVDLPDVEGVQTPLQPLGKSSVRGRVTLTPQLDASVANGSAYSIAVSLTGLQPGGQYVGELRYASVTGPLVPGISTLYATADSRGRGELQGVVRSAGVPQGVWEYVVENAKMQPVAACSITAPAYAYAGCAPKSLTLHVGDTVVWREVGVHGIHAVAYEATNTAGSTSMLMVPTASGSHAFDGAGSASSNVLTSDTGYSLTFDAAGVYHFASPIDGVYHVAMTVTVLPASNRISVIAGDLSTTMPVQKIGKALFVPLQSAIGWMNVLGVSSQMNGLNVAIHTPFAGAIQHQVPIDGMAHFIVNGTLMGNLYVETANDPDVGSKAPYVCVNDLVNILNEIGVHTSFDGSIWSAPPASAQPTT